MHSLTISDLCALYMDWAHAYFRKPGSRRPTGSTRTLKLALRELCETPDPTPSSGMLYSMETRTTGDMMVRELSSETSAMLLFHVQKRLAQSERFNRRTVNDYIGRIRTMFQRLSNDVPEQGWSEFSHGWPLIKRTIYVPMLMVRPLEEGRTDLTEPEPVNPVPMEHVRATALYLSEKVATMVWVQLYSGMRPSEMCGLRIDCIDRSLWESRKVWVYRPKEHKSQHHGKDRIIVLPKPAVTAMEAWMAKLRPGAEWLFEGGRHACSGQAMRAASYYNAIKRTNEANHLEPWFPYQLRHTFATNMAKLPGGAELVKEMLGHSSVHTTRIYIEKLGKTIDTMSQIEPW